MFHGVSTQKTAWRGLDPWPHGPPSQGSRRHGRRWDSGHLKGCGLMTDVDHHGSPWITMDHHGSPWITRLNKYKYKRRDLSSIFLWIIMLFIVVQIDCDCHWLSICVCVCLCTCVSILYGHAGFDTYETKVLHLARQCQLEKGQERWKGAPNLFFGSASLRWQKKMRVSKCTALQHRWNATLESDAHSAPNPSCKYKRPVST